MKLYFDYRKTIIHVIVPHFAVGQGVENRGRLLQTN